MYSPTVFGDKGSSLTYTKQYLLCQILNPSAQFIKLLALHPGQLSLPENIDGAKGHPRDQVN